jgi:hypothetical protein
LSIARIEALAEIAIIITPFQKRITLP